MSIHLHPSPQALPMQCQPAGQGDFYISSTPKGNILNFICSEKMSFCISSRLEGASFCTLHKGSISITVALKMWIVCYSTWYLLQCLLERPVTGLEEEWSFLSSLSPLPPVTTCLKIVLIF